MPTPIEKPVLFVDVDGVLSLFGFPAGDGAARARSTGSTGSPTASRPTPGPMLERLAERFELVWATGWEEKANEYLPRILGLPFKELPVLTFDGRAVFGSSHWKLDAIGEYAGDRPAAWIDDNMDGACELWADHRDAPHPAGAHRPARGPDRRARGAAAVLGRRGGVESEVARHHAPVP